VRRREQAPGPLAWVVGFASPVLPWAGAALALAGLWRLARQDAAGSWYLTAGAAVLAADVPLGLAWTQPAHPHSQEPDLNRRPDQLVGRVLEVAEAIVGGRGKVRAGDTLWPAEGPDMPAGAAASVAAARGGLLVVERAPS
jgi:membrane protein implicated in regulation of membrane protease activity